MSGLAAVLAHRDEPGVYRWHGASSPEEVERAATSAGWRFGHLDGHRHQTKREVLTALGEALALPTHYGRNLDALHDCLRDLTGPWLLLWDGWGTLARDDAAALDAVLDVLAGWPAKVTTLLRGTGPELAVPSLD